MSYYGWKPYVSVAERRVKAEKLAAKAARSGAAMSPVPASRGAIAKTFWGRAWCENLERYSDYANRMPRGRTYVRNGSVIDLRIGAGEVRAQVVGSSLYKVAVTVTALPASQWQAISAECAGSIDSLVELLQGRLSQAVMERISKQGAGLFPAPKEITLACSCPDWADMCKHVAAVLYGVGARLDQQPELLFQLRRVDPKDLIAQASAGLPKKRQGPAAGKVLDDAQLADVFGIELDEGASPVKGAATKTARAVKAVAPVKRAARTKPAAPAQPTPALREPRAAKRASAPAGRIAAPAKAQRPPAKAQRPPAKAQRPPAKATAAKSAQPPPARTAAPVKKPRSNRGRQGG